MNKSNKAGNTSTYNNKSCHIIRKVRIDRKEKKAYQKFNSLTNCIGYLSGFVIMIIISALIVFLYNINWKIDEHNRICIEKFDSIAQEATLELPVSLEKDSNCIAFVNSYIKQLDKHYSMKLGAVISASDARLSREMNNINLWITVWAALMGAISIGLPMFLNYIDWRKRDFERQEVNDTMSHFNDKFEDYLKEFNAKIKKATENREKELDKQLIEVQGQSKIMFLLHLLSNLCSFSSTSFPESAERNECLYDIVEKTSAAFEKIYEYYKTHKEYKLDTSFHPLIVFLIISCDQIKITLSDRKVLRLLSDLINTTEELEVKFNNVTKDTTDVAYDEFFDALKSTCNSLDSFKNGFKLYLYKSSSCC